ncbi:P-loop NTPase fold protein [Bacillus tropicus]|uniref:KAP family P-loop NTPase fold protein n=1 Tax=Bacillus tropicus TaxID=2026188 RepID=UPI002E2357D2|nr:P-loop NTPase fold protein [Bacillus tropicus]
MDKSYFLKDTALENKGEDSFHHHDYVKNIKQIIMEHKPPFNIALIGKWGVGKSSIINLLKKELDGKDEYKVFEINAWKYENDSLKKAFLKNLWRKLNEDKNASVLKQYQEMFRELRAGAVVEDKTHTIGGLIKELKPLFMLLGFLFLASSAAFAGVLFLIDIISVIFTENTFKENIASSFGYFKKNIWMPIIITPLGAMLQEFVKSSMQRKTADIQLVKPVETADEYEELFKEEIEKYKKKNSKFRKLVVIVDDLDRLSPKKVVDALDAIKAFVDVDECIFIVACDENILIQALEKEKLNKSSEHIDGELFLDKLFHFRIPLPPIIESDMAQYALELAKQEAKGLVELCGSRFDEIVTDILIHAEVTTPRQVKKLLNTFANNLLIAKERETDGRKLEEKLLTSERGLRYLAKLFVIQSDYNEVHMNVSKDFNFLDDLLSFYYSEEKETMTVKPTIKRLFEKKGSMYKLKTDYEGLMNFLIAQQHITVDNMAPFIYLAQDAVGLMAGDEKQRNIQKSLVSGNDKGVLVILEQEVHSESVAIVVVDTVKNCKTKDLPSVLKAAYQLIEHIPTERSAELANAIVQRLMVIGIPNMRLWQIELQNLFNVYVLAESKDIAEEPLLYAMDQLFNQSSDWKTVLGKEMSSKDYIQQITSAIDYFFNHETELPESLRNKIKTFIASRDENYGFYPLIELLNLYRRHPNMFTDYFDLDFYQQLLEVMGEEDEPWEEWEEYVEVFLETAPLIRDRYKVEFVKTIHRISSIANKSLLFKIFELVGPVISEIDETTGAKIIYGLVNKEYKESKDIIQSSQFMRMLPCDIDAVKGLVERLDEFIVNELKKGDEEIAEEMSLLIEYIASLQEDDFKNLSKTSSFLISHATDAAIYDRPLETANPYFTSTQRETLFSNLLHPINNSGASIQHFDRIKVLYAILGQEEKSHTYIKRNVEQGIDYFTNQLWYQYHGWASGFLNLLKGNASFIDETYLERLVNVLLNIMPNSPDLALKGLMCMGTNLPEARAEEVINVVMQRVNTDADKIDALYFLKSVKRYFTEENLVAYAEFLIDNIYINMNECLNELYSHFPVISVHNFVALVQSIVVLNESVYQDNIGVIRRTIEKFFTAYRNEGIKKQYELLDELLQRDISAEEIEEILLQSVDKNIVAGILNYAINPGLDYGKRSYQMKLLTLCTGYHQALNRTHFTNLIVDMMRESDDDYIKNLCDVLVTKLEDFKFGYDKRHVSPQIVPMFRSVNMSVKEQVLKVAKLYGMTKEFEQAIENNIVSEEEKNLIYDKLFSKKKRRALLS